MKRGMNPPNIGKKQRIAIAAIAAAGLVLGSAILGGKAVRAVRDDGVRVEDTARRDDEPGGGKGRAPVDPPRAPGQGAHGGTLFNERGFGLEALLAEEGGEARLRIWLYDNGRSLAGSAAQVEARVAYLTGETQTLRFAPDKDSLLSRETVPEPHALTIDIMARTSRESFVFAFTKEEGKVELDETQIKAAGIDIETAGAARIQSILRLPGEIRLNEDRTSHIVPRVAGIVESVQVGLGQAVKKGQVLAVIASPLASEQRSELQTAQKRLALARTMLEREKRLWEQKISAGQDYLQARQTFHEASIAAANARQKLSALGIDPIARGALNRFELRAPFDGLVIEKHLSIGEAVKEDAAVFTISDLEHLWAEINIPAKDLPTVRVGKTVAIKAAAFDASALGTIAFVSALIGEQTRMAKARAVLDNPQGVWRPGLFVNAEVVSSESEVSVAVSQDAIQTVGDTPVVFLKAAGGFVAQPVQLGRGDGKRVEVVRGVRPGARYASAGSFVLKSELGKAAAEHTH